MKHGFEFLGDPSDYSRATGRGILYWVLKSESINTYGMSGSSSSKQKQSTPEAKKSLSRNPDRQVGRPAKDVRSQNGQGAMVQKSKIVSSSKTAPDNSPLSSPKSYNSSAKGLVVKSSEVYLKPSISVTDESKMSSLSVIEHIKDEKPSSEANGEPNEDCDDDKPLSARRPSGLSKVNSNHGKKGPHASTSGQRPTIPKPEDSDDEIPLSSKFQVKSNAGLSLHRPAGSGERTPLLSRHDQNGSASTERKPSNNPKKRPGDDIKTADEVLMKKPKISDTSKHKSKEASVKAEMKEEDDEDLVPISHRKKKPTSSDKKSLSYKNMTKPKTSISKKTNKKQKMVMKNSKYSFKVPPGSGHGEKWTTLVHNGVSFPPSYKPHGVKMLYKGKPVNLTPEQEEVATMYAVMLDKDFLNNLQFKENFMSDWQKILGENHIIQSLEHCDFTPIYEWHQKEKEKKKKMTTEIGLEGDETLLEKKALKEKKEQQEEKYKWAIVDGVKERVGNFKVEPPGLFQGRGEHPRMGKLKKRIRPSDITINIGKDAPIPDCPISGESWKEIRHDNTVTWLAYWNDPINPKEFKYVFLSASSTLKGQSDKEKYEKARRLKNYIQGIRAAYTKDCTSKDMTKRQIAVATYLIDKLALRAGNEKDDDEAITVGCCTLKVENVEPLPPNILKFDFLGKDSIRYERELEVEIAVFKAIQQFRSGKKDGDDLFDEIDTSKLNAHLKSLMPGLTAKVFRTYNASFTLDDMLSRETKGVDVVENIAVYNHANKEVAIICNHQKAIPKSHDAQMLRLDEKIEELKGVVEELQTDLGRAKKGKPSLKSGDGKTTRNLNPDALERKLNQTTAKIEKMEREKETKDDLKTVALSTSRINYLDPRITVAWCKRHEVPIEKIFSKTLLAKFVWAMDVDPDFRF
ncbi:hypothetical protein CASFOL_012241 [Castilleja foliolosa]|uniref:DNA topoisomerase I n=1 Tax=Castilleja foliolosa TaxID=1961234 RepID=A0ABD3DR11_9LAMI